MRLLAGLLAGAAAAVLALTVAGIPVALPQLGSRVPRPRLFRHFESEGVPVRRAISVSAAAALATFAVIWATTTSVPLAALTGAAVAALPSSYYGSRGRKREKEQRDAWPDALRSLISGLNAGRSLHEALLDLAGTGPVPLRRVFARYHDLTSLGIPEAEALAMLRDELADPLTDRIFEVMIVASGKGSRIALKVLKDVADAATADVQLTEKLVTASAELRLQAWAVLVIPWLVLIVMTAQPGDMRDFYASPDGGRILLIGAAMSLGGMVLLRYFARSQPEPRVLLSTIDEEGQR